MSDRRNFDPEILDGEGNLRPNPPDIAPLFFSGPHSMDELPAKISEQMTNNEKANDCCRNMGNLKANLYKSPTANGKPDMMIAVCDMCNRRHYRIAANPIGNRECRSVK